MTSQNVFADTRAEIRKVAPQFISAVMVTAASAGFGGNMGVGTLSAPLVMTTVGTYLEWDAIVAKFKVDTENYYATGELSPLLESLIDTSLKMNLELSQEEILEQVSSL